jgi:hypothetical protein
MYAPLLGAIVIGFEAPSYVLRYFLVVKVFLLKNIANDLVGFCSLVEKGFPGYILCSYAWCFFL